MKKAKTEERKVERKRNVDLKAVQRYIKMQKMKRMEQTKMEREKKAGDEEARKKKLEELRIRTLQLAATSKKKTQEPAQVRGGRPMSKPEPEATEQKYHVSEQFNRPFTPGGTLSVIFGHFNSWHISPGLRIAIFQSCVPGGHLGTAIPSRNPDRTPSWLASKLDSDPFSRVHSSMVAVTCQLRV